MHPKTWELEVQSGIRDLNPATEGQFLHLGLDEVGIGAVCLFTALQSDEFYLMAVAVAERYRGWDGSVADEAITVALEAAADQAAQRGHERTHIFGYVHDRNLPSQRMCQRRGFTCDGAAPLANYQQWSVTVALDPALSVP